MSKLNSRKLWAFVIWTIIVGIVLFSKYEIPEYIIKPYSLVTFLYILAQATIDAIIKWKMKGKDE